MQDKYPDDGLGIGPGHVVVFLFFILLIAIGGVLQLSEWMGENWSWRNFFSIAGSVIFSIVFVWAVGRKNH